MSTFLRWLGFFRSSQVPEPVERAAETYVGLIKSRIIGALVVDDELFLPAGTSSEQRYGLLTALCAYFIARTDMELERRKVSERLREYVWAAIPEAVLEEMGFSGTRRSFALHSILGQSGMFRGVLEKHGPTNPAVLAKTLLVMAPAPPASPQEVQTLEELLAGRFSVLLKTCESYSRYLDAIAAHGK